MAVTKQDLDSFHQFATNRIENGGAELSLEELAYQYECAKERDEVNAVIARGLKDIDAGRGRPAREVTEELRQKYGISE